MSQEHMDSLQIRAISGATQRLIKANAMMSEAEAVGKATPVANSIYLLTKLQNSSLIIGADITPKSLDVPLSLSHPHPGEIAIVAQQLHQVTQLLSSVRKTFLGEPSMLCKFRNPYASFIYVSFVSV